MQPLILIKKYLIVKYKSYIDICYSGFQWSIHTIKTKVTSLIALSLGGYSALTVHLSLSSNCPVCDFMLVCLGVCFCL